MPESIQDLLTREGYTIDQSAGTFTKLYAGFHLVEIPFSALSGHTLETFRRFAKAKKWIGDDTPNVPNDLNVGILPYGAIFV